MDECDLSAVGEDGDLYMSDLSLNRRVIHNGSKTRNLPLEMQREGGTEGGGAERGRGREGKGGKE